MATIRQYFETDFNHVVKIHLKFAVPNEGEFEAFWLVDFQGNMSFLSCYVPGEARPVDSYLRLIRALEYGKTQLTSNRGWTKREFDSVFTREVLEEKQLVLPVWYGVGKQDVYEYSPGLLNVKGLDWEQLGEDEVCRRLYIAIES
jgi:hypothetical protein